ncbi:MAG: pyruvoyl-dependent arginine decarboxylase [Spirochaetales bacterium]|nr:pyruvoyl-dependent arginine decarboxylase [Spirochaetales bacterium]
MAGHVQDPPKVVAPFVVRDATAIGHRIPREYFITRGCGESDVTVHAGSYHLALRAAGIEMCNIITYSSILPACAVEVEKPARLIHGAVMETIMANATSSRGRRATAGLIYAWLYRRDTGEKYGGFVCECNGRMSKLKAEKQLLASLDELYRNGYEEEFELRDIRTIVESFVPRKRFGSALVALCVLNHFVPILGPADR